METAPDHQLRLGVPAPYSAHVEPALLRRQNGRQCGEFFTAK